MFAANDWNLFSVLFEQRVAAAAPCGSSHQITKFRPFKYFLNTCELILDVIYERYFAKMARLSAAFAYLFST
jgi:hypothetical protein